MSRPGTLHRPFPPYSFRVISPITCVTAGSGSVKTVDRMSIRQQLQASNWCVCVWEHHQCRRGREKARETDRERLAWIRALDVSNVSTSSHKMGLKTALFVSVISLSAPWRWLPDAGKKAPAFPTMLSLYCVNWDDAGGKTVFLVQKNKT